jgi:hypothetical protein
MKLAMSAAVAVAASTIGLTAGLAVNAASASTVAPAHHTVWQRELPGWLDYKFQPGSHRQCVVVVNTTPRGDTSVLMCRNGVVEPS